MSTLATSGVLAGEPLQNVNQSRDATDWVVDDEMTRQREGVSKDAEQIAAKRCEGGMSQAGRTGGSASTNEEQGIRKRKERDDCRLVHKDAG